MVNFNVSVYHHVTYFDTRSCKKAAWKSAKTVGKDSSYKSGGLHGVYGQKDNLMEAGKIAFLESAYKLSIATRSHI